MSESKVTIFIDDVPYQISTSDNLLAGVLSKKLNLPYFCWHPSLGSVGACRQCAVTQFQDQDDTRGRIVMACITPVTDGMRISVKNKEASQFREQIIAAMMTNHPHDCPVCAEGGECHLQDMTVMTGHSMREYQGKKRTFTNQYLGELVGHEMNRCITCYRCTRFYNDYAGGKDFGVYGSKNQVYFGRQSDGALESEFSGNLVEVCPTGVFTNKVFSSHYTRKWDLQSAPSVCSHCSVGCNLSIGERYGSVRRVMNRYHHDINGYFLCDRGRYGIGFVNGEQRIKQVKGIAQQSPVALTKLDIDKALAHFRKQKFVGVGSPRASLEANFYLKNIVGAKHFSAGYNNNEMRLSQQHAQLLSTYQPPSLSEIEQSDFILVLAEDVTQTAPRMALAIRQALRNSANTKAKKLGIPSWQDSAVRTIGGTLLSPLFSMQSTTTKLDDVAEQALLLPTEQISTCLSLLEQLLQQRNTAPFKNNQELVLGLSDLVSKEKKTCSEAQQAFIVSVYQGLCKAQAPTIISGTQAKSSELLATICKLMHALQQDNKMALPQLVIVPPCSNSVGLLSLLDDKSLSIEQVLAQLQDEEQKLQGVILLEQELGNCSAKQVMQLREVAKTVIVLDHSKNQVTDIADIVMPTAAVSESDGHYVNYESRAQRFYQVHAPVLPIQDSWRWLDNIADIIGYEQSHSDKLNQTSNQALLKKPKCESLMQLHQFFSLHFASWPTLMTKKGDQEALVARMPLRSSGRTAQMANISVHEAKTTQKIDDDYTFSMEGKANTSNSELPFTWAPGWNSNQAIGQFQTEINGQLTNAKPATYITMNSDISNHNDWHEIVPKTVSVERNSDRNSDNIGFYGVNYVEQAEVYFGEWQAALTPEFQMQRKSHKLFLDTDTAQQANIKKGQWYKVTFSTMNHEKQRFCQHVISQVFIVNELPRALCFGNFSLNSSLNQSPNSVLEMAFTLACDQEVTDYLEQFNDSLLAAKASKERVLEQLKVNDQTIPIRLFSGGLNDG